MEVKKFIECFYEEKTEYVFVKKENDRYEFCLTETSNRDFACVKKNGIEVTKAWNDAIKIYHGFGCSEVKAEMYFCREDHNEDDDGGEAAEEVFEEAVSNARKWLYEE